MRRAVALTVTLAGMLGQSPTLSAQWAVVVGSSAHGEYEVSPLAAPADNPGLRRSISRDNSTGGMLRVEYRTPSAWTLGATLDLSSVRHTETSFVDSGFLSGVRHVEGTLTTVTMQAGYRITPAAWPTRLELTGGVGVIHLTGLDKFDPTINTSSLRPALDLGVILTQDLTSRVGIQAGLSRLFYRSPFPEQGFVGDGGKSDLRVALGLRLAP